MAHVKSTKLIQELENNGAPKTCVNCLRCSVALEPTCTVYEDMNITLSGCCDFFEWNLCGAAAKLAAHRIQAEESGYRISDKGK